MKGQLNPRFLALIGFILLCIGLFDMQNVIPYDIPYISGYGSYLLGIGFIMVGFGMYGIVGFVLATTLSVLLIIGGVI